MSGQANKLFTSLTKLHKRSTKYLQLRSAYFLANLLLLATIFFVGGGGK